MPSTTDDSAASDTVSPPESISVTERLSSNNYRTRKAQFDNMLTIFGRKPVLEVLEDPAISVHCLHLASSNKSAGIIEKILQRASQRNIPIRYHDKRALSRISRNSKQDQGVAADLNLAHYQQLDQFLANYEPRASDRFIALDQVTNPQNLGMIIRSIAASNIQGLLLPNRGSATLGPLVIKASAGTLFKCPIIRCESLSSAMQQLKQRTIRSIALSGNIDESERQNARASKPLSRFASDISNAEQAEYPLLFLLGNETHGLSNEILEQADELAYIPMNNGVESLNVAVTAGIIAFL